MREIPYNFRMETGGTVQNRIYGLLGVVNIEGYNFMVTITEKQYVGKIEYANIYLITEVELCPFKMESVP
jgi:hypothetical protein